MHSQISVTKESSGAKLMILDISAIYLGIMIHMWSNEQQDYWMNNGIILG